MGCTSSKEKALEASAPEVTLAAEVSNSDPFSSAFASPAADFSNPLRELPGDFQSHSGGDGTGTPASATPVDADPPGPAAPKAVEPAPRPAEAAEGDHIERNVVRDQPAPPPEPAPATAAASKPDHNAPVGATEASSGQNQATVPSVTEPPPPRAAEPGPDGDDGAGSSAYEPSKLNLLAPNHSPSSQLLGLVSAVDERGLVTQHVSSHLRWVNLVNDKRVHDGAEGGEDGGGGSTSRGASCRAPKFLAKDLVCLQKIGQGGFGEIFCAQMGDARVAVKVISIKELQGGAPDAELLREQKRERLADMETFLNQQLDHPNVIKTYRTDLHFAEAGQSNAPDIYADMLSNGGKGRGRDAQKKLEKKRNEAVRMEWHLIMEYCPAGSLQDALKYHIFHRPGNAHEAGLDMWSVIQTLKEVVAGLQYLHSLNIIHGDLKPGNVLLQITPQDRRGFQVKISDFGLSRVLSGSKSHISTHTFGTVTHMPPELLSCGNMSASGDVFAIGILMWEIYMSEQPFSTLSDGQVIVLVVVKQLRPPFPMDCPPVFRDLATECWAESPADRPSLDEVAARLEAMQQQLCPEGPASPLLRIRWRRSTQHKSTAQRRAAPQGGQRAAKHAGGGGGGGQHQG